MLEKEEVLLIGYFIAVIFFLVLFVVLFFIAFQRKKNKYLLERFEAEKKFQTELVNAQLEIQEQTLKNIAWELHDNVGQLLSVANIQLNMLMNAAPAELHDRILETKDVVKESVTEVRSLSKSLNKDVIRKNGLIQSLEVEVARFNRLNFLKAELKITGTAIDIKSENEIIIFRILQECFSNVMKHAKASKLFVHLNYKVDTLEIIVRDDGAGFNPETKSGNSGMETMKSRSELLEASFSITSKPGQGTQLVLQYPYSHDKKTT
ncbi:ATP-binding protein [Altibacter sp.]|uniref:sensor histidine kinase n=1 Tax=Altibacter sp. TaxID=2024823 RepID=UPI000C96880F|nr:ATP-binding protein [Altibacter sp.]MAP54935.1 histidine kinase [Altibacter sp.]